MGASHLKKSDNRTVQTTVGSYPRTLEINCQTGVERQLKGLILCFTHWVEASAKLGVSAVVTGSQ